MSSSAIPPFVATLRNEGAASDVFDLTIDTSGALPSGWNVDFAWSQSNSVLVRPGEQVDIDLLLDRTARRAARHRANSRAFAWPPPKTTSRLDALDLDVAASMVSDLDFSQTSPFGAVKGGESTTMVVDIQNLADRPDILAIEAELSPGHEGWAIASISRTQAVMTAGSTVSVSMTLTAPAALQAHQTSPQVRLLHVRAQRNGTAIPVVGRARRHRGP